MATKAKATLDANDEVCGPINIPNGYVGTGHIVITGGITVSLQRRQSGLAFVTVEKPDGDPAAFTASTTFSIDAPGDYQLIASSRTDGVANCALSASL